MKVDVGVWTKLTRLMVVLLVAAGVVAVGVWYFPLIQHNERLRKLSLTLGNQIQQETVISNHLRSAIEEVRTNSKTVERLAREKLGYAKPGETVIRFEQSPSGQPAQPAAKQAESPP